MSTRARRIAICAQQLVASTERAAFCGSNELFFFLTAQAVQDRRWRLLLVCIQMSLMSSALAVAFALQL
jgi:hypothetical protein